MNEQDHRPLGSETGQQELLRIILILSGGAALVSLAVFAVLVLVLPGFPVLLPVAGAVFLATTLLGLVLLQWGRGAWAIGLYMLGWTLVTLVAVYASNGVTGPITVALLLVPLVAGVLGGRRAAQSMVLIVVTAYLALAILETSGVLQPLRIGGMAERVVYYMVFMLVLVIVTYLVMSSARLTQDALLAAEERDRQLIEVNLQLEKAARADREARQQKELEAGHLRQTVTSYSDYLQQVAAGNYEARLELPVEVGAGEEEQNVLSEELANLGRQIEGTVHSLVEALGTLQDVQRRYVQESWAEFARTGFQRDYRYGQGQPEDREGSEWLASMEEAVRRQQVTAAEGELALPITLRGEPLGTIGLRREGGHGWSEAELTLAETIGDQLAQTMESLRLLDQTQRRAASDRVLADVTSRMRETLDVETVLSTAVQEMGRVLGLAALDLQLSVDEGQSYPAKGPEHSTGQ